MKSKNPLILYSFFLLIMITIFGCSSASKTENAQIIPAKSTVWNKIDSEIITDSLITISLHSEWNRNFSKKRKPIIVVGKIEDRSNEKIDVSLLAKNLERSLINSGKVSFIASKEMREISRNERKTRNDFTDKDKFKKYIKSLNSDFFMSGDISLNIDSSVVPVQKRYILNIELIDSEKASAVWDGALGITK